MNFTNLSAASLFFVFLKMDRLMPATWLATGFPPSGDGNGTTPYWSDFMPLATMDESALFWLRIIATFPVAKSLTAWTPLSYWALEVLTTLSVCMRSR